MSSDSSAQYRVLVVSFLTAALSAQQICDNPSPVQTGACIAEIKSAAVNASRFWFGDSFSRRCPPGSAPSIDCYVTFPLKTEGYSLVDLLLPDTDGALDELTKVLKVTYESPPGSYRACSHDFQIEASVTFDVNPLSNHVYPCWDARNMPDVAWIYDDTDDQYSLLIIDPIKGRLHGAWINIPGDNVTRGTVIKSYSEPDFLRVNDSHPFVFILYEQTSNDMDARPEWIQTANKSSPNRFNLTSFVRELGLTGPSAMTWVLIRGDSYSVGKAWQDGRAMNCVPFVEQAFSDQQRVFIGRQNVKLNLFVNMSFASPARSYEACCKTNDFAEDTLVLDPVGNGRLPAIQTQSDTPFSIDLVPNTYLTSPHFDLSDRTFTLLAVDPDVPFEVAGTAELPLLHALTTNLVASGGALSLSQGDSIEPYSGPRPPGVNPQNYFFLILGQQYQLELNSTEAYIGDNCVERLLTRCQFNVTKFIDDNDLDLVGMTWFSVLNDNWVNLLWGRNETVFCEGQEGYANPCPPNSAYSPTPLSWCATLIAVVAVVVLDAVC